VGWIWLALAALCVLLLPFLAHHGAVELFISLLVTALIVNYFANTVRRYIDYVLRPPADRVTVHWGSLCAEATCVLVFAIAFIGANLLVWQRVAPGSSVVIDGPAPFVWMHLLYVVLFVNYPRIASDIQRTAATRVAQRNDERLRVAALERSLAMSELKMLQAQIEPHFLYNVLANVQSMIAHAPQTADAMLTHLIDYLKHALPSMRGGESTLRAEIDLARSYLAIAQLRFGDRLTVRIDEPPLPHNIAMPPMLLLPLVENAIKHGVEHKPGAVSVKLNVHCTNDRLQLRVSDDGAGFRQSSGSGVGIANVRERLNAIFGERASVSVEPRESGGVVSTLSLPTSDRIAL
jgi:two-component sensor histidine kinase